MTLRAHWQSFLKSPPAVLVYGVACWCLLLVLLVVTWMGVVWLVHALLHRLIAWWTA